MRNAIYSFRCPHTAPIELNRKGTIQEPMKTTGNSPHNMNAMSSSRNRGATMLREATDPWTGSSKFDLSQRDRIELGTKNIRNALSRVGHPENHFSIIMVGGTNGKTSTTYFISQLLRKAGVSVGTFSSPHPQDPGQEIQINGRPISQKDVESILPIFLSHTPELSAFELKVCTALEHFKRNDVQIAVMEMGMGGREDAVNVRQPDMAVITTIDLDHTEHLGQTIEEIAHHKADIIPEDGLLVTNATSPGLDILQTVAEERNTEIIHPEYDDYIPHLFHLMVEYHKENASLAMETVRQFAFAHPKLFPRKVSTLNLMTWSQDLYPPEGRFQVIPMANEMKLVLDGAHNPAGFGALFGDLERFFKTTHRQSIVVIMGILADKDIPAMIPHTKNIGGKYFCTAPSAPKARRGDPELLAREVRKVHEDVFVAPTVKEAIESALLLLSDNRGIILVTGSLYMVADAKQWILEQQGKE
jgi:dihydrofolate synthase / folylpolyglutamate synthase